MTDYSGLEGMREARRRRHPDGYASYSLSPAEARRDAIVSAAAGERALDSADLAVAAGFDVELHVHEYEPDWVDVGWHVQVPPDVDSQIKGLVWEDRDLPMSHTLTRSTRHPDWQLTTWCQDGGPWGHRDIRGPVEDAFKTGSRDAGKALPGLRQVEFRDGRVLVRKGLKPLRNPNPRALKRKLLT